MKKISDRISRTSPLSEYRVNLDIFAGPLDLLLYLVRKEELDIYDIPIARITEQYLKYIEILRELDIDLAGDFLVMAATLMEIKSAMLLPRTDPEEEVAEGSEDPRANLIRQLLEYKRFKDAANLLSDAAEERNLRYTRPDSILANIQPDGEPQLDLDQVSIWTLLEAFDHILKATGHVSGYDHIRDDTPIDLYQIEILHRLQTEGPMPLSVIFEGRQNRIIMIGLFLAMLELIRDRLIWAEQPQSPGPIYLKSLTEVPAEQAVQEAIYAARREAAAQTQIKEPEVLTPALSENSESSVEPEEDQEEETIEELLEQQKPRPRIPIQEIAARPSPQAPIPDGSIQKSPQKTEESAGF
jgi:segregation and condensation protein A